MKKFYEMTQSEFLSVLPNSDYEPYAAIWLAIIKSPTIIEKARALRNHNEFYRPNVQGGKPYQTWKETHEVLDEELDSALSAEGLERESYYMALVVVDRIVKHRKSIIEAIAKGFQVPPVVIDCYEDMKEMLSNCNK